MDPIGRGAPSRMTARRKSSLKKHFTLSSKFCTQDDSRALMSTVIPLSTLHTPLSIKISLWLHLVISEQGTQNLARSDGAVSPTARKRIVGWGISAVYAAVDFFAFEASGQDKILEP